MVVALEQEVVRSKEKADGPHRMPCVYMCLSCCCCPPSRGLPSPCNETALLSINRAPTL